ncbi:MAG: choice-of-anchor Q domain-containing protein [Acidimicrobiia bacterium]|nr:choice-of-anchor Q domain-containing protein [Acidimicrobiia bacterium]
MDGVPVIIASTSSFDVEATVIWGDDDGPDCLGDAGIDSIGYNLGSDGTCDLDQPTDITGTDPELGGFLDNGGSTHTRLPDAGSPLVDAIPAGTDDLCDGTYGTDQRGIERPQGSGCDIGAVEREVD